MVITTSLPQDPWSGFTVHQALLSMKSSMPDRIVLLFLDDPRRLQHVRDLDLLLRDIPPANIIYLPKMCPKDHPEWKRLARMIIGDSVKMKKQFCQIL